MKAVMLLLSQYFILHFVLVVFNTWTQTKKAANGHLGASLQAAAGLVNLTPMLCGLFLAPYAQAMRLTGSLNPTLAGLPNAWVEAVMAVCSVVLVARTAVQVFIGAFLAVDAEKDKIQDRSTSSQASLGGGLVAAWTWNRSNGVFWMCSNIPQIIMFSTVGCAVLATQTMKGPPETETMGQPIGMNMATYCAVLLATVFFAMVCALRLTASISGSKDEKSWIAEAISRAMSTVSLAPMLCLLFQAARMHAIEIDPPTGEPPLHVKSLMQHSSHALVAAVLLNLLSSAAAVLQRSGRVSSSAHLQYTVDSVRFLFLMAVYTCAGMVCWSFWADATLMKVNGKGHFHNPDVREVDPPSASTTIVFVVRVATLFFWDTDCYLFGICGPASCPGMA
jgi:hypothetical protein